MINDRINKKEEAHLKFNILYVLVIQINKNTYSNSGLSHLYLIFIINILFLRSYYDNNIIF